MVFVLTMGAFDGDDFPTRLRRRDESILQKLTEEYLPHLHRKIRRFRRRSHIRTWLFGILYRKIAETRRAARREAWVEEMDSNQICAAMDVSCSDLGVFLYRGRNKLRAICSAVNFTPGRHGVSLPGGRTMYRRVSLLSAAFIMAGLMAAAPAAFA